MEKSRDAAVGYLQGQGWTREQALGIAANLQHESRFNAGAVGDGGRAYGIAQWHPDRQKAFKDRYGKAMQGSSVNEQLDFLTYEMREGNERAAGKRLTAATTAADAAQVVSRYYERPMDRDGQANARAALAAQLAGQPYVPFKPESVLPRAKDAGPAPGDWPMLPTAKAAARAVATPLPMDAAAITAASTLIPIAGNNTHSQVSEETATFIKHQNEMQAKKDANGFGTSFTAARHDPRIQATFNLLDRVSREDEVVPGGWTYDAVRDEAEAGLSDDEREYLQENARGPQSLAAAKGQLAYRRELDETYGHSGGFASFVGQMAAGMMDPVSLMAGLGVGKAIQLAGVGSHALAAAGRVGAARASFLGENIIGNVAVEALQDTLGEVKGSSDYAMAAAGGAILAVPFMPAIRTPKGIADEAGEAAARVAMDLNDKAANQKTARAAMAAEHGLDPKQAARNETAREVDEMLGEVNAGNRGTQAVPEGVQADLRAELETAHADMEGRAPETPAIPEGVEAPPIIEPTPPRTPEQTVDYVSAASKGDAETTIGMTKEGEEVRFNWKFSEEVTPGVNDLRTVVKDLLSTKNLPDDVRAALGYLSTRASKDVLDKVSVGLKYLRSNATTLGSFDPNNGRISVGTNLKAKDRSKLTVAQGLSGQAPSVLRNVVHEIVHAVTYAKIESHLRGQGSKALDGTFKELNGIFAEYKAARKAALDSGQEVPGTSYATSNLHEFVAESWSNMSTQAMLMTMESKSKPGRSLWGRVVEAIAKTVWGNEKDPGRLADVIRLTDNIIRDNGVVYGGADRQAILYATAAPPQAASAARNRRLLAMVAHAQQFMRQNPIDPSRLKVLSRLAAKYGGMSDGLVLASSQNPVVQMTSALVSETTTGAAGRLQNVAVRVKSLKERLIGNGLIDYRRARDEWHGAQGTNFRDRWLTGDADRAFGDAVYREINARRHQPNYTSQGVDPAVVKAADTLESGFQRAADARRDAGTLGADRLDNTSRGYITQALDGTKLAAMDFSTLTSLKRALAGQFASNLGWDTRFAMDFANHYVERARRRSLGDKSMDALAATGDGMQVVRDTLQEMGKDVGMRDKVAAMTADLGQGVTKKRLTIDMSQAINGGSIMDAYVTDPVALYRRYMHSTAGEVSLTEFGILGINGVRELRSAATTSAPGVHNATDLELKAMDRVFSEIMGTPVAGEVVSAGATNLGLLVGLQRLGGLVFTQANEVWNMIHHVGLTNTLRGVATLPRLIGEVRQSYKTGAAQNPMLRSMETYSSEFGMEGHKMVMPLDAPDMHVSQYMDQPSTLTRLLRAGGHVQAVATGFRTLFAAQHRMAAEQVTMKALRYIRDGRSDAALKDMGFTDEVVREMRQWLPAAAQWDQSGKLIAFDVTQVRDPYIAEAFVQAVHRGTAQIIQGTFIGERSAWVHNDWVRLMMQLRHFGMTSMEKQWSRTRFNHGYGVATIMLMTQMAAALPLHLARVQLQAAGREDRKKFLKDNTSPAALLRATMNYASMSGLTGDMLEAVSGIVGGWGDKKTQELVGARSQGAGVSRAIPVLGTLDQGMRVATGRADLHTAIKQLPFSSIWYLAPIINLTKKD